LKILSLQDSKKALNVLLQQPEVDPKRITILGHSEGTAIATRVAIDTKVKNIILMGVVAQNLRDLVYYQYVNLPSEYAMQVLDRPAEHYQHKLVGRSLVSIRIIK
jgi:uncharacterized protein